VAELQEIIAQNGPLPIKVTADIETDGPTVVTVAGSVWTTTPNSTIGVGLLIDGNLMVKAQIFSNGANEHRAVVPVSISYTFTIGQHTFTLEPLTGQTTSDANDVFWVTVQY
jgi:hypothetical protein